jgi:hypothetical protein
VFARVKRALRGRRRTVGIVAVLAVTAAAIGFSVLPSAQASDSLGTATNPTKPLGAAAAARKLPPGAKRTTRNSLPKEGPRAKPFSSLVKQPRIVGGELADASAYPYIVGIQTVFANGTDDNGDFVWFRATCTGTVISPTKVLTAGHCATDFTLGTTAVIAGRNILDDDGAGFVAHVQSTWTDPTFNLAARNRHEDVPPIDDVTVLTLKQPLPAIYPPIALAAAGSPTAYDETSALVVGYGVTGSGNDDPGTLRKATIPIHSSTACAANLGAGSGYDNSRMLCAGTLGTGGGAGIDTCNGDSGGPIVVDGVEVGITDWSMGDCAVDFYGVYERISTYRALIDADVASPGVINPDWSGDGHSDLIVRDGRGFLGEYSGSGFLDDGFNGFNPDVGLIGSGWGGFTKVFRVMNWNGDFRPAIMARAANGALYEYKSDGEGGFVPGPPIQVGSSWSSFTDIVVTNNWTGNGHPNIIARGANGDLVLYTSNGAGGWENNGIGIRIGTSWNGFNTILTPGDWKGDGHQALIGRTPNGVLALYESNGTGGWLNNGIGVQIGTGWNGFRFFLSPGDFGGDNKVDMLGVTPSGAVRLYSTDGHGNWLGGGLGREIDTGWAGYNAVF